MATWNGSLRLVSSVGETRPRSRHDGEFGERAEKESEHERVFTRVVDQGRHGHREGNRAERLAGRSRRAAAGRPGADEDVSVHLVGGTYEWKLQGKAQYLESIGNAFHRESVGHHNGHQPEIQILSETEATGIWYLADQMWILSSKFYTVGTALYWDRYLKVDGRWTIKDTKYERIYEINRALDENPELASHYLGTYGTRLEGS
jgi:hypothetical protein